jgi:hypothetical protein
MAMKTVAAVVLIGLGTLGVGFYAGVRVGEARALRGSDTHPSLPKRTGSPSSYLQAALFEAGDQGIVARPVFPLHEGVVIPIKNIATSPLTFGRFEVVGTMPAISEVLVPGKAFTATIEGDRAFTLTGDSIGPNETIEVFIAFSAETSEQGAVLVRFNES